jgi:hypothetical protein
MKESNPDTVDRMLEEARDHAQKITDKANGTSDGVGMSQAECAAVSLYVDTWITPYIDSALTFLRTHEKDELFDYFQQGYR